MAVKQLQISTGDLSITADGRIIIDNPEVARRLVKTIKRLDPSTAAIFDNCNCGKAEALSEVSVAGQLKQHRLSLDISSVVDPGSVGIFDNCNCK